MVSTLRLEWAADMVSTKLSWDGVVSAFILFIAAYIILVRVLRYRRMEAIAEPFVQGKRPLSSMSTKEAHDIIAQLQELEFPTAFNKARKIALLKVCKNINPSPAFPSEY